MREALRKIKVLVLDVDGVLTDGTIIVDAQGIESKNFHVQDGMGLVMLKKAGIKACLISARASAVSVHRAKDLQIERVFNGVYPKISAYETLLKEFGVSDEEVCFMGDDVVDIGILKRVGFAVAVPNAVFEVKQAADHVSTARGGEGAVREIIELILKAQGKWGPELYEY